MDEGVHTRVCREKPEDNSQEVLTVFFHSGDLTQIARLSSKCFLFVCLFYL